MFTVFFGQESNPNFIHVRQFDEISEASAIGHFRETVLTGTTAWADIIKGMFHRADYFKVQQQARRMEHREYRS